MFTSITEHDLAINLWVDPQTLLAETIQQAVNAANHPRSVGAVALMPDTHCGYGVPIGAVVAYDNAVVPYNVGADAGCGMGYVATNIDVAQVYETCLDGQTVLDKMYSMIKDLIPVGFTKHDKAQYWQGFYNAPLHSKIISNELENAKRQLGTLGGGNHFIELQRRADGKLCAMLHSGSRHLGYALCDYYNNLAEQLTSYPQLKTQKLAYLDIDSEVGKEYLAALTFSLRYARANRQHMMENVKKSIYEVLTTELNIVPEFTEEVNIHHNYAAREKWFGREVWVHRKGAIHVPKGAKGIIPGCMGTASYIVEGLGNELSMDSASHGAGRTMGRKAATRNLSLEDQEKKMEGILYPGFVKGSKKDRTKYDLGEAPDSYKDIEEVMDNQTDLVKIVHHLKPIAVQKG